MFCLLWCFFVFFFKQKTAYEMRISDWSSDVCSSDLPVPPGLRGGRRALLLPGPGEHGRDQRRHALWRDHARQGRRQPPAERERAGDRPLPGAPCGGDRRQAGCLTGGRLAASEGTRTLTETKHFDRLGPLHTNGTAPLREERVRY